MIDFQFEKLKEKLLLKTTDEGTRLIWQWSKESKITLNQFKELICIFYIKNEIQAAEFRSNGGNASSSYNLAVELIAMNDGPGDTEAKSVNHVSSMVSVGIVSTLLGVSAKELAKDIVSFRKKVTPKEKRKRQKCSNCVGGKFIVRGTTCEVCGVISKGGI